MDYTWTCSCYGRTFDTLPMDYGFAGPSNWFGPSEAERSTRAKLTNDVCVIDGKEHYIQGCLEIPVSDSSETLIWGVWVSVSEESFRYILDRWNSPIPRRRAATFWMALHLDKRLPGTTRDPVPCISAVRQFTPAHCSTTNRLSLGN